MPLDRSLVLRIALLAAAMLLTGLACDRPPPVTDAGPSPAGPGLTVRCSTLLPLRADTRTFLRPLGDGRLLVGQPDRAAGPGGAVALVEADGRRRGLPVEAAVGGRLGVPAEAVRVRDVLVVDRGRCVVLVGGSTPERSLLGLWLYRLDDGAALPLVDADALAGASGLGRQIDLVDGRLVAGDGHAWVCLSGFGQTAVLRCTLDLSTGTGSGSGPRVTLQGGRDGLKDDRGQSVSIEPGDELTAGDPDAGRPATDRPASDRPAGDRPSGDRASGDRAILGRPAAGKAWRIDFGTGGVTERPPGVVPLAGVALPGMAAGDGSATRLAFIPDDRQSATDADVRVEGTVRYPAFVLTGNRGANGGDKPVVIDRDAIQTRPGFPTHALRITSWCVDAAGGGVIAYDAMSGEVLRLEIAGG